MKVNVNELAIINLVLQTKLENGEVKQRTFPFGELDTAIKVLQEIKKNVQDDKFVDGEVKLDLEGKSLVKKLIQEREWGANDGEAVKTLTSKLDK